MSSTDRSNADVRCTDHLFIPPCIPLNPAFSTRSLHFPKSVYIAPTLPGGDVPTDRADANADVRYLKHK